MAEVVDEVTITNPEDEDMAEMNVDQGNLAVAMTMMANEGAAASSRRTNRFDQLGADAAAMWAISMQTPSQNAALALRTATESGSGQTRVETNRPQQTTPA